MNGRPPAVADEQLIETVDSLASERDRGWCPTSAVVDELPMEESAVRKRLKRAAKSESLPIEKWDTGGAFVWRVGDESDGELLASRVNCSTALGSSGWEDRQHEPE